MAAFDYRPFSSPDEVQTPRLTTAEMVDIADGRAGRFTFQPGWRWSECIKPLVGTDSCQVDHLGYCVSGRLHITYDDGTEGEIAGGGFYHIGPGHDAWVVDDEQTVIVEFQTAAA